MEKEQTSVEDAHQIIREIIERDAPKTKKATKKNKKLVETDIDLFAEDEKEQQGN